MLIVWFNDGASMLVNVLQVTKSDEVRTVIAFVEPRSMDNPKVEVPAMASCGAMEFLSNVGESIL